MGSGVWNPTTYRSTTSSKKSEFGTSFVYDKKMRSKPKSSWTVHEDLDPKRKNKAGAHSGLITRESLDSDEHPETLPIVVMFDVTGSMHRLPKLLQEKLPQLHGLILRKGYAAHPQIMFGGIGDAYVDRAPLQVSQFESDNRMDEHLTNILLEGGGGGGNHESYELAAYFMNHHTYIDSLENRGKKGYFFIIGDERPYAKLEGRIIREVLGEPIQQPYVETDEIFRQVQEKYNTFFLFADEGSYSAEQTIAAKSDSRRASWRELLGQNALVLDDASAVCETIAVTIGMMEGVVSLDEGLADLKDVGSDSRSIEATSTALAAVKASGSGSVVQVESPGFAESEDTGAGAEAV